MGPVQMLFGTIIFGPIHLLITFVVEYTFQFIYSFGRELVGKRNDASRSHFSLFSLLALVGWIALTLSIPFGYQSMGHPRETNALVYRDYEFEQIGDVTIDCRFDPETGLEYELRTSDLGFADRYNMRIDELIRLHGIPNYSIKNDIPDSNVLVQLLDATDLIAVDSFPLDLSQNIHLMRRGIKTPEMHMGLGNSILPVHYKLTDTMIYVRNGPNWVGAFLRDGRLIMSASR